MTLPEALYIVSQNAHGVKHNYWNEYLPAILMVNEAYPITGYVTVEHDASFHADEEYREWIADQNKNYDERNL